MKGKISAFFRRIFLPNFSKICGGVRKRRDTRKFPSRDTSELRATVDPRIPFAPAPAKPAIRQESDIKGEVCVCDMRTCWPNYSKIGGGVWKPSGEVGPVSQAPVDSHCFAGPGNWTFVIRARLTLRNKIINPQILKIKTLFT